jgi:hypothetical protein
MGYPRISFVKDGQPGFTVELPPGLVIADPADAGPLPPVFTGADRLVAIVSPNGPAVMTVSLVAADDHESLYGFIQRCAAERGLADAPVVRKQFGGENHRHLGLVCESKSGSTLAAFEDSGAIIVIEAVADLDIWADYQPFLMRAMLSIELLAPGDPILPLMLGESAPALAPGLPDADAVEAQRRELALNKAASEAAQLISLQRFADAEALILAVDQGSSGCVELGRLYEQKLRDGDGDDASRETLFHRALAWKLRAWPDPHTQIEAEHFSRGAAEERARLIALLGHEPRSGDS